jgi:transcriptional regulator with XRE-family HTH domain
MSSACCYKGKLMEEQITLGGFIERVLHERHLSGNALAQAVGIAEGSVRNLLKYGREPNVPAPGPQTLRAIADFLQIEPLWLYQLADYLPRQRREIGFLGEYVGRRFEALPPDNQAVLLNLLAALEGAGVGSAYGEMLTKRLPEARQFRQRHLTWFEQMDRRIAQFFGIYSEDLMLRSIHRRLSRLFPAITPDDIARVAKHPMAMAFLGILLSRKDMPSGLEKLYYVTVYEEDKFLPTEEEQMIHDTWELLASVANLE